MIIVADTGPLNYLLLIGNIDLLPQLYGEVLIPPAVQDELLAPGAPAAVRLWMMNPPRWLEVRTPSRIDFSLDSDLDEGELEAIALVQSGGAGSLLLMDDLPGRMEAERLGLDTIGTLGILRRAHQVGLTNLRKAVETLLTSTNFRASDQLIREILADIP